jgi:glycosyltransferase involved in cell wall biosynthesis
MSGIGDEMVKHGPMISVCMITYNHEPYIARAIEGVLEQESPYTYELVIGEDHSTDRTREICLEYERMHPGVVTVLRSNVNLGITGNFARTLGACAGKYVALCEGDDFWTNRSKLHQQVKVLEEHPEYVMTCGRVEMVNEVGLTPDDTSQLEEQLIRIKREPGFFDLLEYNMINTPTVCIRRDVMAKLADEAIGRGIRYSVDYWYWLRMASGYMIYIADEVFASYRVHPGGASRQGRFLRKRMPWIRYDAICHYLAEHNDVTGEDRAALFAIMAGIVNGRDSDLRLRFQSFLWCISNIKSLRAWLRCRFMRIR